MANRDNTKHGNTKHGLINTTTYNIWRGMKQRCTYVGHKSYKKYGGSGITICDRWMRFENFYADMGERPEGLTLERKKNSAGYSPENCRWATYKEQSRNNSRTRLVTAFGRTQCVNDWALEFGIDDKTVYARLDRGWSAEKAISQKPSFNSRWHALRPQSPATAGTCGTTVK